MKTPSNSLFSLFFGTFLVLSASSLAAPVSESDLADRLKFYRSVQSLDVRFSQTKKIVDAGMEIASEGRLRLGNPAGGENGTVVWEITKPAPVRITLDGKGIDIVNGTGAQASHQHFSSSDMPQEGSAGSFSSLGAWLKLDAHAISENYAVESSESGRYRFTPKKSGGPFAKLELEIGRLGHLERLNIFERSGDEITLRFSKPTVVRSPESLKKTSR